MKKRLWPIGISLAHMSFVPSQSDNTKTLGHASKPVEKANHLFHVFATKTSHAAGSPITFLLACLMIVVWAICGPIFRYSDTWQLVINTSTTVITFLIVFLIQNTQNRDARAIHLKLDELIRSIHGARNELVDLENCSDEELVKLEKEFHRLKDRVSDEQELRQSSRKGRRGETAKTDATQSQNQASPGATSAKREDRANGHSHN